MEGMLAPTVQEAVTANAEVTLVSNTAGSTAGLWATEGQFQRKTRVCGYAQRDCAAHRRNQDLKRFKDDVNEVQGYECGISIKNFSCRKATTLKVLKREGNQGTQSQAPFREQSPVCMTAFSCLLLVLLAGFGYWKRVANHC
jgi:hypothetical protein